jgi:HORMA domain
MADALSHKYLATMQLSIYDGEVSSLKRLEAYIMVFSYSENGVEMELQFSGARGLPSPPGKTISSAKQELRFLVHRLANHIGGFPELSRKQYFQTILNSIYQRNQLAPLSVCISPIIIPALHHMSRPVLSSVGIRHSYCRVTRVLSWGASIKDRIGEHFESRRLYQLIKLAWISESS